MYNFQQLFNYIKYFWWDAHLSSHSFSEHVFFLRTTIKVNNQAETDSKLNFQNKQLPRQEWRHRSCCSEVFCRKGALKDFAKFTGKHLYQSLLFNKVAGLKALYLKRDFGNFNSNLSTTKN